MGEKKLLDLVAATKDEAVDYALSDVLPETVKIYGEVLVSEGIASLAGELIGAICPRFNNIRLSYKQNRLERNVATMLNHLIASQETLTARIDELERTAEGRSFVQQSSEMLLDNIVDEIQPSKVQYSVNGYVNLLQTENANFDMALMFFKTIAELNDIDIRVLKNYDWRNSTLETPPITPFNSEFDYEQLRHIKEKLLRFGLLRSKNEELNEKNQEMIIDFLQKFYKDYTSKKPKGVKIPKFKKISSSDSYRITSLGAGLLQLISEKCDMTDLNVPDDDLEESED